MLRSYKDVTAKFYELTNSKKKKTGKKNLSDAEVRAVRLYEKFFVQKSFVMSEVEMTTTIWRRRMRWTIISKVMAAKTGTVITHSINLLIPMLMIAMKIMI